MNLKFYLLGIAVFKNFLPAAVLKYFSLFTASSKVSNASKFGFISLVKQLIKKDFVLIDCQQETKHLESLGAVAIKREDFIDILNHNNIEETYIGSWENYFTN